MKGGLPAAAFAAALHCTLTRTCESKGEMSLFMSMFARTKYLRHCMRRWTPACEDIGREGEVRRVMEEREGERVYVLRSAVLAAAQEVSDGV